MVRRLGRVLLVALVLLASVLLVVTVGPGGVAPAGAQTDDCLPPPTLIYGEIAQVAGTNSQLWADVQAVEQADEAAGTADGSGQVIQDVLAVINRDGYQWDCATGQLETANAAIPVSPGIPTIPDAPAGAGATTTTPTISAGPATTVTAPAATAPATHAAPAAPGTTPATLGNTGLANSSPVGVGQSATVGPSGEVVAPLALANRTDSGAGGSGEWSTLAVGLLALVTAALLVLVVRRQMRRR